MNDEQMFIYQSGKWYGLGDFFDEGIMRRTKYTVAPPEEIAALQGNIEHHIDHIGSLVIERDMALNEIAALCEQGKTEATMRKELAKKYNELIYMVGNKYPTESRHETALRYIKEAEQHSNEPATEPTKETPRNER